MSTGSSRSCLPPDLPGAWRGVRTWAPAGPGWQPWRVDPELVELVMSATVRELARIPNGVRLDVVTDATRLEVACAGPAGTRERWVDVVVDGHLSESFVAAGDVRTVELPGNVAHVELWLPHSQPTRVDRVLLHGATVLDAAPVTAPRWVVYGSSITQCNDAPTPTQTWPALVARRNLWDLTALGMSGQCHLDPPLAQACGQCAPDVITLCLGTNVYGGNTFNARSLGPTVAGFVALVRTLTTAPIIVVSPLAARTERETTVNAVGLTQADIRDIVHDAVGLLQRRDDRLHLIDGTEILSGDELFLLSDGLHPTPEGYRVIADRLGPQLAALAGI